VALAGRTAHGACLRMDLTPCDRASIRLLADRLRDTIENERAFQDIPLVLLVRENLGKVFGQWVTNWGHSSAKVVVIDEIDLRDAQFGSIGRLTQGVVPVSLYGMNATGESL
jgi:ethanolamine utilization protein EutA (predicted chaperonin)